jgi:hypothetical protein
MKGERQATINAEIDIDQPHKIDAFSALPTIALSKYAENIKVMTTVAKGELAQSYIQYATKGFILNCKSFFLLIIIFII